MKIIEKQKEFSIMQLIDRYNNDERQNKLNLTVGVYTDQSGCCPILDSVREAEYYRAKNQISKATFSLTGASEYHEAVRNVLFPSMREYGIHHNIQVVQTLGASGALHLVSRLIKYNSPTARIWISTPTWENHPALLSDHSHNFGFYRYQPANQEELCLDSVLEDLHSASPGDFVLLQACCHNPTGMDPDLSQWNRLADFCAERRLIPLFDFAYQGFAHSIEQDAALFDIFRDRLDKFLICSSFSKNMGIYGERTGALTFVFRDEKELKDWINISKELIRSSYSTPPIHGSFIVSHIINDPIRFTNWQQELTGISKDLQRRRTMFFSELTKAGIIDRVLPYRKQNGMFLCLDLSQEKINSLRENHGIYFLNSGRISIASLSISNMPRFCEALKDVV
ncbi:aromatic amino acid transaminase [Marininema halotolerans]|uniref:Aspartate aminotransferase/aromatic-amino-acid transaminase n=1 Tax=Marininema halotolerans TaxID=1155944 RepID=A0A1I6R3A7_9BACL|nr:aromatic amino acid transaminase [Marininema halotolerans]SFS59241.1 aspartate aminotransferase/aromatic-amino-acid transaminase [Marininema halotolerans]